MMSDTPTQSPAAASNSATAAPSQTLSDKQMLKALAHHQTGKLKEAEEYYRQVLRLMPAHPDANNLLGVLLFQTNRSQEGLTFLDRAVQVKPQEAMFYYNYAVALRVVGDQAKAMAMLAKCIELNPNQLDAINVLIEIHEKRHEWEHAIALLQRVVSLKPLDVQGFRKLGEALHQQKRYAEAATHFSKACGLSPNDAHIQHQLGLSLQAVGDLPGAAQAYARCIELNPSIAPAHNNLAIVLAEQGDNEQAIKQYERSLEINPQLFQTKCNLGGLLRKTGDLENSVRWLNSAVDQKPDCAEAWCNLGNTLGDVGETEEAMACYRRALLIQPDYTQGRLNRALGLLRLEKFDEGWVEYEWRYKIKECPRRQFGKPRWDGRALGERVLMLHAEQGLGDTFQMVRYVKHLHDHGNRVILECQKALVPFLTQNGIAEQVIGLGDKLPHFDLHLPLMSAPSVLYPEYGFLNQPCPYLHPKPELKEKWGEVLRRSPERKIGIFWQGNPSFKQDRFRSIPLSAYAPLLELADVGFVSLQKGFGSEQIASIDHSKIIQFDNLDDSDGAFMDSAAILPHLDLLVTSDSAIAHLAGALGVRTFLVLPYASDWRWFVDRNDSPWYPTMTLFRKQRNMEWLELFQQLVQYI